MVLIDGAEVWKLHATHGFPLDFSIPLIADREGMITWDRLIAAATRDGVNVARLLRQLQDIVGDAYPPSVAEEIRRRLPLLTHRRIS